jgi:transposase
VIGIDIGKNSFHIVGLDERGRIVLRQKWSRGQVEARFANMPPCLIGMEACVGAHHLSRKLKALGHDARLMPAKYVRPIRRDRRTTSVMRGDRRGRAAANDEVRGDEDRRISSTCRRCTGCGSGLVSQRTGIINQIRAFLLERGIAVRQGTSASCVPNCRASWPRPLMCCRLAWRG